jgi:hypothetical protein
MHGIGCGDVEILAHAGAKNSYEMIGMIADEGGAIA